MVEEINEYFTTVLDQNFSSSVEEEGFTVKKLQNFTLFTKDLFGINMVSEKNKRILKVARTLYRNVLEIKRFQKATDLFRQILKFEIKMEEKPNWPKKPYVWMITWLEKYFATVDIQNEKIDYSQEIVINSDLNMKITISPENKSNYFKISFVSIEKQATNLLFLIEKNPLDILYLIFWLKCVGVERLKFFLENNHQILDNKKLKKFSRWENFTEVSNKIKDLFNSEKGFNAAGGWTRKENVWYKISKN